MVEHDEDAVRMADFVVDIGPGAGAHGGEIVAQGTPQEICDNPNSITGKYLTGELEIAVPKKRQPIDKSKLFKLKGASGNKPKKMSM